MSTATDSRNYTPENFETISLANSISDYAFETVGARYKKEYSIYYDYLNTVMPKSDSSPSDHIEIQQKRVFFEKTIEYAQPRQQRLDEKIKKVFGYITSNREDYVICKLSLPDDQSIEVELSPALFDRPEKLGYGTKIELSIDKSSGFRCPVINVIDSQELITEESIEADRLMELL